MDLVDTLHVARYWSEVLWYILMTPLRDLQVKVIDFELSFYVSGLTSLYFLSFYKDPVDTMPVARYWSEVLCYTLMTRLCDLQVKVIDFELSFNVSSKILTGLYFLSFYKDPVDTMLVARYCSDV